MFHPWGNAIVQKWDIFGVFVDTDFFFFRVARPMPVALSGVNAHFLFLS